MDAAMTEARVRHGVTAVGTAGVAALLVVAYVVGSGGGSSAKAASSASPANLVTVDGTGQAAGTPDSMITTFSVDSPGADPSVALSAANTAMAHVQQMLKAHGVADKDLSTTGLSVNPNYNYSQSPPTLTGFTADEQLQVELRNLSTAGATVSAVLSAGGPQVTVGGLSLDLAGDSGLVTNARAAAYADAKTKAEQYAALASRTLGPVVSVSETVGASQPPVFASTAAAATDGSSVPIAAGSQNVSVDVTVVFSLQ
jgi:uncharacterized protein